MYIYIYRERDIGGERGRDRERERGRERKRCLLIYECIQGSLSYKCLSLRPKQWDQRERARNVTKATNHWVFNYRLLSHWLLHPAVVRCDMVLHQAFRARHVRKTGIGCEVRYGVTSGVSCETSLNKYATPHLHRLLASLPAASCRPSAASRRRVAASSRRAAAAR